ncbi:MAG: choice-of-anchor J domain-containing protein [Bacteroidales bacterium]|nr:choice-of-anchor J domain-containing protein [Bacteroidales bacterium]
MQASAASLSASNYLAPHEPMRGEFFDGAEDHSDFTINSTVNGWSYIDGDGSTTYGHNGADWPDKYSAMAFMVFNPYTTSPPIVNGYPELTPHTGNKYFTCWAAEYGTNNDWMISPELTNPTHLSFWAMTYDGSYGGLERMKVGYSTTGTAQGDFTFLTASPYVQVPESWTFYEYDLPAGTKYIAINCVSYDAFIFMVDDITITQGEGGDDCPAVTDVTAEAQGTKVQVTWTAPSKALTGYKIYQDNVEKATVAAGVTEWISDVLPNGTYTFAVAATFDDGCSPVKVPAAPVEIKTCNGVVSNLEVKYETDCSKATITWDAAGKSRSEVLWDNTDINIQNSGLLTQYWSGNDNWIYTADDFIANDIWTIETITAKGFSNAPSLLPTKFRVIIYQNGTDNKPGTEIFDANNISVTDGADPVITLPTPFTLPAAGTYWITIAGVYDASVTENSEITSYRWNIYYGTTAKGFEQHLFDKMGLIDNPGGTWKSASALGVADAKSMYFKIEGNPGGTPPEWEYNIYRDGLQIGGPTTETTFVDTEFDPEQPHTWSVAIACANGGDGEWVDVEEIACGDPVIEPCDPITGGTATIDCTTANLTWTAVAGAKEYKVSKDGATTTVTEPAYTETGEFEDGVSYTWTIVTVCDEDESDAVEITGVADCSTPGIPELANSVSIYPNPTSGTITISALNFVKVEIYNTVGQLIETKTDKSFEVSYNTGIYFFKVYDVYNNSVTKRVMVK